MPIVPLANVNRENLFSISLSLTFVNQMAQTLCWQDFQDVKKYVGNDKLSKGGWGDSSGMCSDLCSKWYNTNSV